MAERRGVLERGDRRPRAADALEWTDALEWRRPMSRIVPRGYPATLAVRGATLIDGTGAPARRADVGVSRGRIEEIGDVAPAELELDVAGLTVLPGLIDAHGHLGSLNRDGSAPAAVAAAQLFENCGLALDAGFTTIRDVGGVDGGIVAAIDAGLVRGPRILPSGPLIAQYGGHGDKSHPFTEHPPGLEIPGLIRRQEVVDSPDQMRRAVRRAFKMGATQIKICVSGGVLSYTDRLEDTQFSLEEIRVAVFEAEARGSYVTAHCHNSAGMRLGLEGGIRCFEHASYLDEPTAALAASRSSRRSPWHGSVRRTSRRGACRTPTRCGPDSPGSSRR
jgi:imidazolonepropionase-like amidohydrolase